MGFAFIFGIIIGSFLNVCIYRLPKGESVVYPASYCPYCKQKIPFYHNIPLISYLLLKGRCARCGHKISLRYFVVELLAGVITVFAYIKFGFTGQLAFYLFLFYALIVISFIDFETHLILNKILLVLFLVALGLNTFFAIISWKDGILGFVTGGGILLFFAVLGRFLFKKDGMGMGDVKFAAVAGFFLGWKLVLIALYAGFIFALLYYLIGKMARAESLQKSIPMAPFFSISIFLFLFYGDVFLHYYIAVFIH